MLVLTRKIGESILIPSHGLTISVGSIKRGRVRLRISAPPQTRIVRSEVARQDQLRATGFQSCAHTIARTEEHEVCPTSGEKED